MYVMILPLFIRHITCELWLPQSMNDIYVWPCKSGIRGLWMCIVPQPLRALWWWCPWAWDLVTTKIHMWASKARRSSNVIETWTRTQIVNIHGECVLWLRPYYDYSRFLVGFWRAYRITDLKLSYMLHNSSCQVRAGKAWPNWKTLCDVSILPKMEVILRKNGVHKGKWSIDLDWESILTSPPRWRKAPCAGINPLLGHLTLFPAVLLSYNKSGIIIETFLPKKSVCNQKNTVLLSMLSIVPFRASRTVLDWYPCFTMTIVEFLYLGALGQ